MPRMIETEDFISLELTPTQKLFAFHGSITQSRADLVSSSREEKPWRKGFLKGIRCPGTGIPGVLMIGTLRSRGSKDFAYICGTGPVRILEFSSGPFKRWIVSEDSISTY